MLHTIQFPTVGYNTAKYPTVPYCTYSILQYPNHHTVHQQSTHLSQYCNSRLPTRNVQQIHTRKRCRDADQLPQRMHIRFAFQCTPTELTFVSATAIDEIVGPQDSIRSAASAADEGVICKEPTLLPYPNPDLESYLSQSFPTGPAAVPEPHPPSMPSPTAFADFHPTPRRTQ